MRASQTLPEHEILETWPQIASYLGVSERTARRWADDKGLPVERRGGHVRAYKPALERWQAERDGDEQAYIWRLEVLTLLRKTRQALEMDNPQARDFARKIDHVIENAPESI